MDITPDFTRFNAEDSFKKILDFKGEIAPIAEKACRNFEVKTKNPVNRNQRLHYFAVGHAFKQMDYESVFGMVPDNTEKKKMPTANKSLLIGSFSDAFINELKATLGNIRNINSHYVHSYEKIRKDTLSDGLLNFIQESFELAVINIYIGEENEQLSKMNEVPLTYESFIDKPDKDRLIVSFLYDKFFPLKDNKGNDKQEEDSEGLKRYKEYRNYFRNLATKDDAINSLLFVDVSEAFDWKLYDSHKLFTIAEGSYLSFHACLFMMSLFLYKDEANQLISKIKGFKKNETKAEQSKRDVFTFFAKKFSSQDINSEENNLVKFRDIIQYLNHYPVEWTKKMELESDVPLLTGELKHNIIEMEIDRAYPMEKYPRVDNERFHIYTRKNVLKEQIDELFSDKEKKEFDYILFVSDEFKDAEKRLNDLEKKLQKRWDRKIEEKIGKTQRALKWLATKPNATTEKLKERIKNNSLYMSYGRNQDRFIDFAVRYLAEVNYFGRNAQFKLYTFYNSQEQDEYIETFKLPEDKKALDDLKYHRGKIIHFTTWLNHLKQYPEWDTPFVIENNAIQVQLVLGQGDKAVEKTVGIQRALLVYFLEDALYHSDRNPEDAGLRLLTRYFFTHQKELTQTMNVLSTSEYITTDDKKVYKKLLPKRLLNQYAPAQQNNLPDITSLQLILAKTVKAEDRYKVLLKQAADGGRKDDFMKRNKGKQFKLLFVRKAWNLMFFRDIYFEQRDIAKEHHKQFHITRDEYNDFCRYMFAFDEVPSYKRFLKDLLEKKGFLKNSKLRTMLENASSLDSLYSETKHLYSDWLNNPVNKSNSNNHPLINYTKEDKENDEPLLGGKMFYINLSHFIKHSGLQPKLFDATTGKLKYRGLENKRYLIAGYYCNMLSKDKTYRKMFNDLQTAKLEDSLLYELAIQYLVNDKNSMNKTGLKHTVLAIQKQDIRFDFRKDTALLFELVVPFKNIDRFAGIQQQRDEQYWEKLVAYMEKVKEHKHIKRVYADFIPKKEISLDNLNKIHGFFVGQAIGFSKMILGLEKYFIFKHSITIPPDENKIQYKDIASLSDYFTGDERNNTFHFDMQDKTYGELLGKVEDCFIKNEVLKTHPVDYDGLMFTQKNICEILLSTLHDEFYGMEKDGKKKRHEAQTKYFNQVINKK